MAPAPYFIAGIIAALLAIISLVVAIRFRRNRTLLAIILAFWAVAPPLYFFFEFHYVRQYYPDQVEKLKDSQQQAARVWAGVAAALGFLFVRKDDNKVAK